MTTDRQPKKYGKKIAWHKGSPMRILQIYNKGLEFALVSNKFEQCHPFVWCKDFLHDVIYADLHDKVVEIYRFKYNPQIDPRVCRNETRLLVTNQRDSKLSIKIDNVLDFVNQIEEVLHFPKTKVRKCINSPQEYKHGVFLFQGSKRWQNSPPLLSLYSLLIRIGFSHQIGTNFNTTISLLKEGHLKPYQTKDSKWIAEVEPALHKIIRLGDRKIFYRNIKFNYPQNFLIDHIHNSLGIMAFARDMRQKAAGQPVQVAYWHRLR